MWCESEKTKNKNKMDETDWGKWCRKNHIRKTSGGRKDGTYARKILDAHLALFHWFPLDQISLVPSMSQHALNSWGQILVICIADSIYCNRVIIINITLTPPILTYIKAKNYY